MPGRMPYRALHPIARQIQFRPPRQQQVRREAHVGLVHQPGAEEQAAEPAGGAKRHRQFAAQMGQVALVGHDGGARQFAQPGRAARVVHVRMGDDDQSDIAERQAFPGQHLADLAFRSRQAGIDQ